MAGTAVGDVGERGGLDDAVKGMLALWCGHPVMRGQRTLEEEKVVDDALVIRRGIQSGHFGPHRGADEFFDLRCGQRDDHLVKGGRSGAGGDGRFAFGVEIDAGDGGVEMDLAAVTHDDFGKGIRDALVAATDVAFLLTFAFALLAIEAGPEPQGGHVVVAVAELGFEHRLPELREGVFATEFGEPTHGGDIVETFVADQTADKTSDADSNAIEEAQRGELE